MQIEFTKYHALGNDYLVLDPKNAPEIFSESKIERVCHRNFGLGSDGILYGPIEREDADFGLRIFNPDGSEAEKSGNGLRIFCRYLFDIGAVSEDPFTVWTPGGVVECQVFERGKLIEVEMGTVSFDSTVIPVEGEPREVIKEEIKIAGETYIYCAATVGNPHAVFPMEEVTEEMACNLGPLIENHPNFPNRTNVQFLKVIDRNNIQIEIWERGAGYTLASGTSSSAAASVAYKLGLVDGRITVHSPGGELLIEISEDYSIKMTGPTTRVGDMHFEDEAFEGL